MAAIRWVVYAALACDSALAQTQSSGSISGVVRESTSGTPMEAARVMLFEHDLLTRQIYTDGSGRHSSTDVEAGPVRVRVVTRAGQTVEKTVSITPGQNLACDISVSAP